MQMTQEEWEASVQWVGVVAGCVIEQNGMYLLVQEKQQKAYGLWNLPAGYVDKGEEIEAAAVREAKEETGLDVKLAGEIGVWHEDVKRPVKHAFRATVVGGDLHAQEDEILDIAWLTYDEIAGLDKAGKLRAPWVAEAVSKVENS